jgi:hypothetical protein
VSTFLALCQKVNRLARISLDSTSAYPAATTNQTGQALEIVNWVNDAYSDIQNAEPDWGPMQLQGSISLTANVRTYSRTTIQGTLTTYDAIRPFLSRDGNRHILVALTATGVGDQTPCYYVPYAFWRGVYDFQTRPTGKPQRFTIQPGGTLEFDPTPDATYTAYFDYRRTVDVLSGDSDTPIFDSTYDDAIVWGALMYYNLTRDAPDQYQKWKLMYDLELGRMRTELLPEITMKIDDLI